MIPRLKCFIMPMFMLASMSAFAQSSPDTVRHYTFGLFYTFPMEFPKIDYGELNQLLDRYGYPECRRASIIVGLGFQLHANRGIVSFTYNSTRRRPESDSFDLSVRYRSFAVSYGYNVIRNPHWSLYPYLGFKSTSINYLYNQKISDSVTTQFGQYFQTPLDHKEINSYLMNLDLGAGFSYQSFWIINLRSGFLVPLDDAKWTVNKNQHLENAPTIRFQYYINVTLGLGVLDDGRNHLRRPRELRQDPLL